VLQRVLRDFIESPMYPKREANRRRAADSGRIVGNPYLIALRQSCPSCVRNRQALIDFLIFDEGTLWGLIWDFTRTN
jgi:hypothetical protein